MKKDKEYTININTKERDDLRKKIARDLACSQAYNNNNGKFDIEVKKNKRIDIVMGLPGSGKSSAISNPISEEMKSVIIDADFAKELLPEYEGGKGADILHKESKLIAEMAIEIAMEENKNIIVPVVGKTLENIKEINEEAKKYGYEIHLHINEVPLEVALGRVKKRAEEEGRDVPEDYIRNEVGNKPMENYNKLKEMNIFDSYARYDNNVDLGERPKNIEMIGRTGISGLDEIIKKHKDGKIEPEDDEPSHSDPRGKSPER